MKNEMKKSWRDYMYAFFGILLWPVRWLFRVVLDGIYAISCKIQSKKNKKQNTFKNRRFWTEKTRRLVFVWGVLAIPIIQFCIFYIAVNIESILLAFQYYDTDKTSPTYKEYVFFNFGKLFTNFSNFIDKVKNDPTLVTYTLNSVWLYLLGYATLPITLFFSFFIVKKLRFAGVFQVILFLPAVLSSVVEVTMFSYIVEEVIPELLHITMGIEKGKSYLLREDCAFWLMWFFGFWTGFGSNILIYCGTMSRVPESLVESAKLDGISLFGELIHIYFPLIFPTIATLLLLGVAKFLMTGNAAFTFYESDAPESARTLAYYFYIQVVGSKAAFKNYPEVSAASLLITFIGVPVALIMRYVVNKFIPPVEY